MLAIVSVIVVADVTARHCSAFKKDEIMSNAYIIEVQDTPAGIVIRDGNRFQFCASDPKFFGLEGQRFSNPQDAEEAARRHVGRKTRDLSADGSPQKAL